MQIPPRRVGGHHDLALDILAADGIRAPIAAHIRQGMQRQARPRGRGHQGLAHPLDVLAGLVPIAQDQIKTGLSLQYLGQDPPIEGRLDGIGDVTHPQPMARDRLAANRNGHEGDIRLLLDHEIHHFGDLGHPRLDRLGDAAQLIKVIAKDLHRNTGAGTREHMIHPVGDGLANRDVHAGNPRHPLAQLGQDGLHIPVGIPQGHLDFRAVDLHAVLGQIGAARPPGRAKDLRLRQQGVLELRRQGIGLLQGCPRWRVGEQGETALVKGRQKGLAGLAQGNQGHGDQHQGTRGHGTPMGQGARQ